jgi:hypothetical protein
VADAPCFQILEANPFLGSSAPAALRQMISFLRLTEQPVAAQSIAKTKEKTSREAAKSQSEDFASIWKHGECGISKMS